MIKDFLKKHKTAVEIFILLHLIFVFIAIRSLHFSTSFNFSTDQAEFSIKALELWRNKQITLVGPAISWRYEGHYFFQGSITYYVIMFFMLLGKRDPLIATYLFVLFSSLMVIPLYYGVKMLINKQAAFCMSVLFVLFPLFVDYTRFFWNPNFQFVLTPLLIICMGLYKKNHQKRFLFLISFFSGTLFLFHYQFIVVILGLIVYYLFVIPVKTEYWSKLIFLLGFPLGFFPMILFELKNKFYSIKTFLLFIQHSDVVFDNTFTRIPVAYYFLSILIFVFLILFYIVRKKISFSLVICFFVIFLGVSLFRYIPKPQEAFGMAKNWNFVQEKKVYEIIRKENLKDFNIVNLGYDTLSTVQKYFLIRDQVKGNWNDYLHNKYLFVITYPQDYLKNPAYEVNTFTPSKVLKKWTINKTYDMYLLVRIM